MQKQLHITTYGMPILRKKSSPVIKVNADLINTVENMFYTMDLASGIGLAAPQVNLDISLAVIDISGIKEYSKEKLLVLINPEILESHGEADIEEGCLSIPDVRANVVRPETIFLKNHDFDLTEREFEFKGFMARVIQHEIDHLNGKLFIDYLSDSKKKEVKKHLALIKKGKIDPDYPILIHTKDSIKM